MQDEDDSGQSFLAYLSETTRRPARVTVPYERETPEIELRPYAPPPSARPATPTRRAQAQVDEQCMAFTRQGKQCEREPVFDYGDSQFYCPSHAHLIGGGTLKPIDVDAAVAKRLERDAADNPPSLHLILQRVRAMIDANQHGDRAALRDSLVDLSAAAAHAAREIV